MLRKWKFLNFSQKTYRKYPASPYLLFQCHSKGGCGFHAVMRPLGSVKPFLGGKELIFDVGAHNSIYFMDMKIFPSPPHYPPHKKEKRAKIGISDNFESFLGVETLFFFCGSSY